MMNQASRPVFNLLSCRGFQVTKLQCGFVSFATDLCLKKSASAVRAGLSKCTCLMWLESINV